MIRRPFGAAAALVALLAVSLPATPTAPWTSSSSPTRYQGLAFQKTFGLAFKV